MMFFGQNKKIQQLEEYISKLQEELKTCRIHEIRVKELETELIKYKSLDSKLQQLETELIEQDVLVNKTRELEKEVSESKEKDLRIQELEKEISENKNKDLRIQVLENELTRCKSLEPKVKQLEAELINNHNRELRIKELEDKLSKCQDSERRIHELEGELQKFKSSNQRTHELESQLAKYQKIEKLDSNILTLETQYNDLIKDVTYLKGIIADLEVKRNHINASIDAAASFYKDINSQNQFNEVVNDFRKLNEHKSDLQGQIESLQMAYDELNNETNRIKTEKDKYWEERINDVKSMAMHELYQAVFQPEYDAIRLLSADVDALDISKLKENLDLANQKYRQYFGYVGIKPSISILRYITLYKILNEYIQINISLIVKQMNTNSWETILSKTLLMLENVDGSLSAFNIAFDNNYKDIVLDFVKAKYLVVTKQLYDKHKEQEERKAQLEYERAIKKAIKDEEKAQEQLEKKQREIENATNQTTISKLNEQIKSLKEALLNAKELRERAMSMAQQTKSGYVYVISNIGSFGENVYKIGMTRRLDPMDRISELSNASVPFPFDVHAFIYSQDAPDLETKLHHIFDSKKVNTVNYRKEYFRVTLDEIKAEISKLGINAEFHENPDAFQFRESLRRFSFI